ncbi:MAG: hypothetical protein ACD_15C00079G0007 [uncultured bacterium]|nr:MAG: hypothetical protein ACD_15C00079G0007 [uncultured bacterium]HCU70856.1 hypothetical protein [Candidatus Moranbacteria bacterium]
MDLGILLGKIGISPALTQDISLLLIVAVFSIVFGMFIGRYKLITILINIYVSFAITQVVPDKYFSDYLYELTFFLLGIVILTISSRQLFEIYISGSGSGFLWRVFAMSFLEIIFLLSIVLSIVPKKMALEFVSPTAFEYMTGDNARLIWMIVPLVFMVFIHKRLNR